MTAKPPLAPKALPAHIAPVAASAAGLNCLIFGPGKVGKTALATSILRHRSVKQCLHIDVDGSPDSLPHSDKLLRAEIPSGADGWRVVSKTVDWLTSGQHDVNAVILDTVTTLGTYGLDDVLLANYSRMKRSEEERLAIPSMSDYGANNRRTVRLVRQLRELSVVRGWHVILLAHEKETKLKTGQVIYRPALSGAAGEVVPGIPDMLGRLEKTANGNRLLRLASNRNVEADYRHSPLKARDLPEEVRVKNFADPASVGMDLADLWDMIEKERKTQ